MIPPFQPDPEDRHPSSRPAQQTSRTRRRFMLGIASLAPGLSTTTLTHAASPGTGGTAPEAPEPGGRWPLKAIRLIVPTAPGTMVDRVARSLADPLGRLLGQSVIAENRPGNHGNLAATLVGEAPPDGYTLLIATEAMPGIHVPLYGRGQFNPARKLSAVNQIAEAPLLILASRQSRFRSLTPLIRQARREQRLIHYGCNGHGSASHLAMEWLRQRSDAPLAYQNHRDLKATLAALSAGELDLICLPPDLARPALADQQLRALAVTSAARADYLPKVMPLQQQSIAPKDYRFTVWVGLMAPGHTPAPILQRIDEALAQASRHPAVTQSLERLGYAPHRLDAPETFQRHFLAELARNQGIIAEGGLRRRG
ncbi:MAG: tripartite tricarboxylate transporter substrate-binding protein [Lautropia sp.]|nr:tripartite tricarboxylate transporter substrate-binding protein [Lautropia sp.]